MYLEVFDHLGLLAAQASSMSLACLWEKITRDLLCKNKRSRLQDWWRTPIIFSLEAILTDYFCTGGSPVFFSPEASQTP